MNDDNRPEPGNGHHGQDGQQHGRRQSWLERWVLPPREGDSRVVREVKSFIRVGLVVAAIFVLVEVGRSLGWW